MAEPPKRPPPPQRAKALTPEEVARLLEAAQGTRYYPMVFLTLALGLRRGELLGLRWEDVDWAREEIHVRRAVVAVDRRPVVGGLKTQSSQRVLPLLPEVKTLLMEWRVHLREAGLDGGFIFPSSTGAEVPIAPRTLDRAWAQPPPAGRSPPLPLPRPPAHLRHPSGGQRGPQNGGCPARALHRGDDPADLRPYGTGAPAQSPFRRTGDHSSPDWWSKSGQGRGSQP